jgi:alpha-beta hydrolase superfamily lysophospholipase
VYPRAVAHSEELTVRAGDAALTGTLTFPDVTPPADRRGRYPNALLLPSWLARDRDGAWDRHGHVAWYATEPMRPGLLARLADALAARGVASLRCDPRGCGASDGAWEVVPLFTKIDDARDMLAAMRSHGGLDLRRSGIVGHGEGATLALAVAVGDPAVGALTLIGPAARSWRDVLRRGVAARARFNTDREHPIVAALDRWSEDLLERAERRETSFDLQLPGGEQVHIELSGVEQAIHTPARALATMLHRSVTLAHGAADRWSDPDESTLLAAALTEAGNRPDRRVVPGAGHDLGAASDEVIGELADDFAARLLPRDLPPVLVALEEMG